MLRPCSRALLAGEAFAAGGGRLGERPPLPGARALQRRAVLAGEARRRAAAVACGGVADHAAGAGVVEAEPEGDGAENRILLIAYGAGPRHGWNREIDHLGGGRGVYVRDPRGHACELFTAVP
ncbi:hypothetical protein [Actinomadura sp. DC4]|uniref:hypothetical protein n=1 Tax=Actinomadura sp. DC4 TaxID=3055069 RepID=UPI0025B22729|nr:hypothetical protein [Actinomadura sp. DC4]MDN3356306.1 hypothetical protein [Actinomadura sp. DC4]